MFLYNKPPPIKHILINNIQFTPCKLDCFANYFKLFSSTIVRKLQAFNKLVKDF